jgi:hypothetical protein
LDSGKGFLERGGVVAEKAKPAPKENKKGKKLQGKTMQAVRNLKGTPTPFQPIDG